MNAELIIDPRLMAFDSAIHQFTRALDAKLEQTYKGGNATLVALGQWQTDIARKGLLRIALYRRYRLPTCDDHETGLLCYVNRKTGNAYRNAYKTTLQAAPMGNVGDPAFLNRFDAHGHFTH